MKKKKKFKNISLYCKPVNIRLYFCMTTTLIGIIGGGFLAENLSPSFLHSFFSCLWSAVILFGIIRLWIWYRKQRFYIKLEKDLYFFLQSYNLCQAEIIDREKVVSNSAIFGYLVNETEIIIRAYKQGDIYTCLLYTSPSPRD